jgi:NAD(P)-dependent dehydrogenase (short-subunit alcohol dehydrogenase family)
MDGIGMLAGKVAIVTGASTGIGAAAAAIFAREGAQVVIAARREAELTQVAEKITADGGSVLPVVTDVTVQDDVIRLVRTATDEFGRLDVAFNNAGTGCLGKVAEVGEEDFDRIMDVNFRAVWLCMRHQIRAMLATGGGSVVNNSAVGGIIGSPSLGPYGPSKHGVVGLTRAAAADYAGDNIRVNAIAPGTAYTPLIDAWFELVPGIEEKLVAGTPIGRIARAEEIAEAAAWLASDRASYVTGAVLPVDGGFTIV